MTSDEAYIETLVELLNDYVDLMESPGNKFEVRSMWHQAQQMLHNERVKDGERIGF